MLLEKASFAQAMELILRLNGLDKKVLNSKTIIIYPATREKDKQYGDQIIRTFYLSHIDAKKAVNLLRTMLQLRKIFVHEELNALIIRDTPDVIQLAEQIINSADRENSEVLFALEIVSVSDTDELDIGPELSTYSIDAGFSADGTNIVSSAFGETTATANLVHGLSGLDTFYTLPSATYELKKTYSSTEILASPKIRVRNREKAKVHIGSREPVITTSTTDTSTSSSVQYVDVGVKVDVEPTIQLNNTVETKLRLEVSQVTSSKEVSGTTALTISTTNAETVLTLKDGVQTIIGGLFEQLEDSTQVTIPILGDVPLFGRLFTNFDNEDKKREILLSITPYIVKQVNVPVGEEATIWSGGEDDLRAGRNFAAFAEPAEEIEGVSAPLTSPTPKPAAAKTPVKVTPQNVPVETMPIDQPVLPVPSGQPALPSSDPSVPATLPVEPAASPEPPPVVVPVPVQPTAAPEAPPETPAEPPIVLEIPVGPPALSFVGPQTTELGAEFSVTIHVADIERLYSAPMFVKYDPALLDLVDLQEGDFLGQKGQSTVFSSSPNRTTGQVIVGYKQGIGGTGASGSGSLFSLKFKAKGTGAAKVELNRINFRDPSGVRLPIDPAVTEVSIK